MLKEEENKSEKRKQAKNSAGFGSKRQEMMAVIEGSMNSSITFTL